MKHVVFYSFILLFWNESYSQVRFARIIDFDNKPQFALELHLHSNSYYLSYTGVCVDDDGQLLETCSGIIKMDTIGNVEENVLINKFTIAFKSLNIDRINHLIIFSGDEYNKNNYTDEFKIYSLDLNNLLNRYFIKVKDNNSINSEYFQIISEFINDKVIIGGSINQINQNITTSKILLLQEGILDTVINFNFLESTSLWNSLINKNNLLTLSFLSHKTGGYNNIHILKFDEDLNQIWHWTADNVDYIQKPYICELHDGRLVVTISDPVAPKIASLEAINPDKSRSWKYRFPDISGKIQRRVYRIKTMQNGDIVGMGSYGNNTMNLDARITEVPYVFRMTSEGRLLWEKVFYRTRPVVNHCIGSIHDVVEAENGDLIAVGRLDNYLEYDPVVFQGRPDPDILIIRMDANGCIDDKCEFITKIENVLSSTDIIPDGDFSAYLFPNPSDGSIDLMNHTEVSSMTIFDLNGRMVYLQSEPSGRIDLSGLAGGLYIVHINLKNKKLIRQKIVLR